MSGFILCKEKDGGHTLVPDFFVDNYMPEADGEYVKIYLYLLRCLKADTQELSVSLIAEKFDHTENYICRALRYWEKMRLLELEYDGTENLAGVRVLNGSAAGNQEKQKAAEPEASAPERTVLEKNIPEEKNSERAASSKRIPADLLSPQEAQQLLFICEQYLGKTLSSREVAQILDLHDSLGFSAELIEYLVEYCVSGGHKSIHYIEGTARGWCQDGIRTVSQARQQTTTYNRAYYKILKAFGISSRNPVEVETAFMNKWLKTWGFSLELILEACSRTMAAIHQPSFEYADKILSEWKKQNIASPAGLEQADRNRQAARQAAQASKNPQGPQGSQTPQDGREKESASAARRASSQNRFHNFRERDYDFEKLQKQLINQ